MPNRKIDIAIVGGGVSGVYSAWMLKKKYPKLKIEVFEGGDHIGGRLLSVKPPCIDDMVAELGGMRIMNSQVRINALITALNKELPKNKQIKTYPFPVDQPQNIAYLRGVHLRLSELTSNPNKVPYQLNFLEKGSTSGSIITNALEQIIPGITNPSLTEEERIEMSANAVFDGKPLYAQGFWNVLYKVISGEAYQFSLDSGGYNTTLLNWNAADAIPWFLSDFGNGTAYFGFTGGFQQVPIYLGELFEKLGGKIHLNTKLEAFDWKKNEFEIDLSSEKIFAGKLILAMPRRSLDLLAPTCPQLQRIQPLIASVTPRPLFKVFTTYKSPWWLAAGYWKTDQTTGTTTYVPVQSGRTVTDLPVRQTYYWPKADGSPATTGRAMLLASYDDGSNIGFWDGLRPQRKKAWKEGLEHARLANAFEAKDICPEDPAKSGLNQKWSDYEAPEELVNELAIQLRQVHDLSFTPDVRSAAFRDWGEDPYGGGWNSWNIGVKSGEVRDAIVNPIKNCPLYICGEAYSNAQGWVEGALQTADIMLKQLLKDKVK
jgi:monoamine oxidase